jgi:hypothetical protein
LQDEFISHDFAISNFYFNMEFSATKLNRVAAGGALILVGASDATVFGWRCGFGCVRFIR